jgi:hypothetical protein
VEDVPLPSGVRVPSELKLKVPLAIGAHAKVRLLDSIWLVEHGALKKCLCMKRQT